MRIAIVGAIDSPTKRDALGGTEIWNFNFAQSLVKRGIKVSLFCAKGSKTDCEMIFTSDAKDIISSDGSISKQKFAISSIAEMIEVVKRQDEFDLIHISVFSIQYALPFVSLIKKPVVITVHGSNLNFNDAKFVIEKYKKPNFVFISKSFAKSWPKPSKYEIIYNGIALENFKFSDKNKGYLFWMSRISSEKGVEDAIAAAKLTAHDLYLAGPIRNNEYFEKNIKPNLNKRIKYLGTLGLRDKVRYFREAKAFLFPIKWDEPFGLVLAESMACGTPVIAYKRGAVTEIIDDNINGFIVAPDSIKGIASAVGKVDEIKRERCRSKIEKNFTIDKMVDRYIDYYKAILGNKIGL